MADESKQATGNAWGDDIREGRKAELEAMLQDWEDEADHGKRRGPFDNGPDRFDVQLTGADVYWLSARVLSGNPVGDLNWETIDVATGRLLEDAATAGDLAGNSGDDETGLEDLHLEGAILWETDLRGALLWGAHLEHAKLNDAHLEGAVLTDALLQSASLFGAHLEGAVLRNAHLEMADLEGANLEAASLDGAHLEQTNLRGAHLGGSDMRGAYLDDTTALNDISLADEHRGGALLADVRWRDANLAVFSWSRPHPLLRRFGIQYIQAIKLGDELVACTSQGRKGKMKDRHVCLRDASAAVRANRQVATALRAQGLNEAADRFAYRAQVCQRKVLRLQRHYVRYLGSLFLWLIAGYGYRPLWSFLTYVAVVAGFAVAYVLLGPGAGIHFLPLDAAVFSITSFHGRGFMPGEPFTLHSVIAVLAAAEASVGLLIEIIFIATFTQRFFAR